MADAKQKEPGTVCCTIDGLEVDVPEGTRIIEAAARVGIDVPHYCYHPGLSAPAQCRMCLVEVEGAPKLMPACTAQVADGQVVHTHSESSLEAREGVLEFLLINHPLDCPVCDQSGECGLQDYVAEEGRKSGRYLEPKRVLGRDDFGGDVLYYGDRCILCTRCVRFMREVAQDERLAVVQRGHRGVIDTFFDEGLDGSLWSGNVVDICPVGSLVSKDFLHKARAWDLDRTPSVCPSCSQGCNIRLETFNNQVMRLKPRPNSEVNSHWMCDYGRHEYDWMNRGDRLEVPMVRRDDRLVPVSWSEAMRSLADLLSEHRSGGVAVASPGSSNEDLAALRRVLDSIGGGRGVFRVEQGEEEVLPGFPKLALRRDRGANVRGLELLGFERVGDAEGRGGIDELEFSDAVVFLLGDDLAGEEEDVLDGAATVVFVGHHFSAVTRRADVVLPATTFAEMDGSFTNHEGRVQRFWPALRAPGMARPGWQILGVLHAGITGEGAPGGVQEAFAVLGGLRDEFRGVSFDTLGATGRVVDPAPAIGTERTAGS